MPQFLALCLNKIFNTDFITLATKLPSNCIDLIITDPPWGCDAWQKGDYIDDENIIKELIPQWLQLMHKILKPSCHIYVFVPALYIENWLIPFKEFFTLNNRIVCNNMKTGRRYKNKYRNNFQDILYGSKERARNLNIIDWILTSDSWFNDKRNKNPKRYVDSYPAYLPSYVKATVEERTGSHPDEKNENLITKLILVSSKPKEIVFDGFCGSGVVPASAKKVGRGYIASEINNIYYKESLTRI